MSAERETLDAPGAPTAVGPYTHAVRTGGLLFCSGQIPLDPGTGELVGESPAEQCRWCLQNLAAVCEAAGTSLERAVRLTVYTTRLEDFGELNEAYAEFFPSDPPARVVIGDGRRLGAAQGRAGRDRRFRGPVTGAASRVSSRCDRAPR